MLKAYADAYAAIGEESFLKAALLDAKFIEKNMLNKDGHLWRNYKDGKSERLQIYLCRTCTRFHHGKISVCNRGHKRSKSDL